jgi:hypothetical protein
MRRPSGARCAPGWGILRRFAIQYVEIGNEDHFDRSGSYEGRYAQFYKAIKAKLSAAYRLIATAAAETE